MPEAIEVPAHQLKSDLARLNEEVRVAAARVAELRSGPGADRRAARSKLDALRAERAAVRDRLVARRQARGTTAGQAPAKVAAEPGDVSASKARRKVTARPPR